MKHLFFIVLPFVQCICLAQSDTTKEVLIGKDIWMTENLNVDRFRNGDLIKEAKTTDEWLRAAENKRPAWCYYNNDSTKGSMYGRMYNWYAVIDPRGLAPQGWHISTDLEWEALVEFSGGRKKAGKKLKSRNGWARDANGNNESGFNGLPGGIRWYFGDANFNFAGDWGCWWMAPGGRSTYIGNYAQLLSNVNQCFMGDYGYGTAASVRCVKNK